jgi:hypothetical protein
MANNTEDIKWLYGKLKDKGYDIGSQQEFTASLANETDREWYYNKAVGMGLNVGSKDDFNSLYAPAADPTPQPQQAQPTQAAQPQPTKPTQPTWQPAEQEKIRMAYNLNSIVSDFNKRSRARVEQARRVAERNTPEGRKKLKVAKFQAQLAGTPTQVLGLTTDVSPAPDNGQGGGATGDQPKPLLSGQSRTTIRDSVLTNSERELYLCQQKESWVITSLCPMSIQRHGRVTRINARQTAISH